MRSQRTAAAILVSLLSHRCPWDRSAFDAVMQAATKQEAERKRTMDAPGAAAGATAVTAIGLQQAAKKKPIQINLSGGKSLRDPH